MNFYKYINESIYKEKSIIKWIYNDKFIIDIVLWSNDVVIIPNNDTEISPITDFNIRGLFFFLHRDVFNRLVNEIRADRGSRSSREHIDHFIDQCIFGSIVDGHIKVEEKPQHISTARYQELKNKAIKRIHSIKIFDDDEVKKMIDFIRTHCQKFIREMKFSGKVLLYRGSERSIKMWEIVKSRIDDRRPRDLDRSIHDALNDAFLSQYGWKARNGVFVSTNKKIAFEYGITYIFFPIGNYKYLWSPKYADMYKHINWDGSKINYKLINKIVSTYKDDDYNESGGNEISFNCNEYVLVNTIYEKIIKETLVFS